MRPLFAVCAICIAAVPASAADLILPAVGESDYAVVAPASDWTAFYAGVFGGYTAGKSEYWGSTGGPTFPYIGDAAGGLIGFQLGADYQVESFVIGAVADIAWANLSSSATGGGATFDSRLNYLGTVRARVGVANESLLGYVHGGLAYGSNTIDARTGSGPMPEAHGNGRIGYTLGAGVEAKVSENISLLAEYSFTDLGDPVVFSNPPGFAAFDLREAMRFHTVKVGVNYRF